MADKPKICTACNHVYMKPCNGKDKKCPNLLHLQAKPVKKAK